MQYVLDASVAIKWVINEPGSPEARRLRDICLPRGDELIAPEYFAVEVANVLTKAQRRGVISSGQLSLKLVDLIVNGPELFPTFNLIFRAVEIATEARIGLYDCLYVALAEREDCELITADERLKRALPDGPIVVLSEFS